MSVGDGPAPSPPLLALKGVCRDFSCGGEAVRVLSDIDLGIDAGEMVAIVGPSGSGKSTLMNILGCLDHPSGGDYRVAGQPTRALGADELARLRREHFGFIFQRYHLLADLSALANTEMPAIYAGVPAPQRRRQAMALLARLGLGDRMGHRPSQLSGGQQQRVGIARALINGGGIILADEPTGALDSHHGAEVMKLLSELNAGGHTVIIVTHDMRVAEHARRVVEISDGRIVADRRRAGPAGPAAVHGPTAGAAPPDSWRGRWERLREASTMALLAMRAHRLRTLLTMMGIVIGIASVVSVAALGEGSRQKVAREMGELGTNTLEIYPGQEIGAGPSAGSARLTPEDADALALEPYVDSVAPTVGAAVPLRYAGIKAHTQVNGVGEQYFRVKGMRIAEGRAFSRESVRRYAQEAVIDQRTGIKLFGQDGAPVGKVILLGGVPVRVVGVVKDGLDLSTGPDSLNVWLPYTAVQGRLAGSAALQSIGLRMRDTAPPEDAKAAVARLLRQRQGGLDFHTSNNDALRETVTSTNGALNLLITSIALISLLVGGIGVMNIMLVSVSERTREIGIRMAVGARQGDILRQFLIESVLVCLIGGVLGIALSFGVGHFFNNANRQFSMVFSAGAIAAAFATCTVVGVLFGFVPARNAARLNPVEALARES
ncbi:MacB family efflux pump subunit [Pseudoduganella namucuonensis]|uniref:Pyoverdine export ATP-binding/permease protein PvdT n=1 Tax=Pseudoduganella namucuonensis TaxID=1035707 RepID=A0A1I7LWC2_9BURK|nr:MacB family efflux pump subunit [Pseudoduganella namucuonensis]SFV13880.1 macrolide transport system ATP-binding/permease protein [Pseudoduganella namucuonensis]